MMQTENTLAELPALILIAEDDDALARELSEFFALYSFRTQVAPSWNGLMQTLRQSQPDLILLDKALGPVDTVARISQIRRETCARIIIVTGYGDEADCIIGLELGADGFLHKPVPPRELVARCKAALRRACRTPAGEWRVVQEAVMTPDGRRVTLGRAHRAVLAQLIENPGRPVPRHQLMAALAEAEPQRANRDRALGHILRDLRRQLARLGAAGSLQAFRKRGWVFSPMLEPMK